jgi:hypothetical protein
MAELLQLHIGFSRLGTLQSACSHHSSTPGSDHGNVNNIVIILVEEFSEQRAACKARHGWNQVH